MGYLTFEEFINEVSYVRDFTDEYELIIAKENAEKVIRKIDKLLDEV